MDQLGYGDHTDDSCLCPFHDDHNPSFSVYDDGDRFFWKCFAGCGGGDEVDFLMKEEKLEKGSAIRRYLELAQVRFPAMSGSRGKGATRHSGPATAITDAVWEGCVASISDRMLSHIAEWRGYSDPFCRELVTQKLIGDYRDMLALPIHGPGGNVVGLHCHMMSIRQWIVVGGCKMAPLVIGDLQTAELVFGFESQWDAFAVIDRLGWHDGRMPEIAIVISRGAGNGRFFSGVCPHGTPLYLFKQNDEVKNGSSPADSWVETIRGCVEGKIGVVPIPPNFKDANDWTRAGATADQVEEAIHNAIWIEPNPVTSNADEVRATIDVIADNADCDSVNDPEAAEVRSAILRILEDEEIGSIQKKVQASELVVEALRNRGTLYFHEGIYDFETAMFFDSRRKILHRISSDAFQAWLSEWASVNRADTMFTYIVKGVETAALNRTTAVGIIPEKYWAARDGAIYLSNGDGAIVKITGAKVAVVDNGTDGVVFCAGRTLRPWQLVDPVDPFERCSLLRDASFTSPYSKDLLRIWACSLPSNPRCKPPLALAGPVRSGKTRIAKGVSELFGIPFALSKADEKKEGDFWPSVDQGGIFTLDNVDSKISWLPDAIASAATDGCSLRRRLYTDSDTVQLRANAWVVITSANPSFAADAGLSDRLVIIRMGRREGETDDVKLSDEIALCRDAGLSFIAELLSKALADHADTPDGLNARHPDFARFAVKLGRALGREKVVVTALREAEADKARLCLENDYVCSTLLSFIQRIGCFEGSANHLVDELQHFEMGLQRLTPKGLSKRLQNLWPHIQAVFDARKQVVHGGALHYTISSKGSVPLQTSRDEEDADLNRRPRRRSLPNPESGEFDP